MRGSAAVLVVVLAVVVSAGLVAAAGAAQGAPTPAIDEQVASPDRPILVFDIGMQADGDATWNITARFPIGEDDEAEAFDAIAEEYAGADPEEYLPITPFEAAARELRETLDRSMWIEDVERNVVRTDETGMLTLEFTWTGFGEADDERVHVGDVFVATEQTWLSSLEEDEYLLIRAPEGYTVESSGMPVQNVTMWAAGPADLGVAELRGTFVTTTPAGGFGEVAVLPALGGLGATLALVLLAVVAAYRREWAPAVSAIERVGTLWGAGSAETAPDGAEAGEAGETAEEADALGDLELLGDEELVLRLIERNGGRMKQASIVEETDWSNAKVSQLLSEMAEAGEVEKLRIGRENLITLAGDSPEE